MIKDVTLGVNVNISDLLLLLLFYMAMLVCILGSGMLYHLYISID